MYVSKRAQQRKRRRRIIVLALAVVLVVALVSGVVFLVRSRTKNMIQTVAELPFTEEAPYAVTRSSLYYLQEGKLHALDKNGKEIWTQQFTNRDLQIAASDYCVVVYNTVAMQVLDPTGVPLISREFAGEVQKISSASNVVGVLKKDMDGTYMLHLFDFKGQELDRLTFDHEVMDFNFGWTSTLSLDVITLDTNGSIPVTRVQTYNESFALTSVVPLEEQLTQSICYVDSGLYITGTRNLYLYDAQAQKQNELLIYGWKLQDTYLPQKGGPVHVFTHSDSSNKEALFGSLRIVVNPGEETLLQLPNNCIKVLLGEEKLYCVTTDSVYSYSYKGVLQTELRFQEPIDSVLKTAGGKYLLVSREGKLFWCALP